VKLLHFADVHLGMENYGRVNAATGLHSRFEDGMKCLAFIVDAALERGVDAAIFAGDAYRNCDPNPTHQHGFASQMRRLRDAGIPLVLVPGNHDLPISYGRKSAIDIFSALGTEFVFVFTRRQIEVVQTKSGPIQVAPFPWPVRSNLMAQDEFRGASEDEVTREIENRSAEAIGALAASLDPTLPAVLVAHVMADKAETAGSEYYAAIIRDPRLHVGTLANEHFDYVALGHVHKFQDLNKGQQPPVVYPGSMDRINFGEEKDRKGFCIVDITRKGHASYEFIPTPTRPFVSIDCTIDANEEPTLAVLQAIDRKSDQLRDAVVRIIYDAPEDREIDLNLKEIHRALEDAFLVDAIARAPRQITERARRSDLTESLGWPEALDKYAEVHADIKPHLPDVKECAHRIEQELNAVK
jgi:DNA repair protein SbcD/Mre11